MALLVWFLLALCAVFTMLTAFIYCLSNVVSFLCGSVQGSFPALNCAVCILCSATKFLFILCSTTFPPRLVVAMLLVRNNFLSRFLFHTGDKVCVVRFRRGLNRNLWR